MTEKLAKALAAVIQGQAIPPARQTHGWQIVATRPDGCLVCIEEHGGRVYRDQESFDYYLRTGRRRNLVGLEYWLEWGDNSECFHGMKGLLNAFDADYRYGWVMSYWRPDGRLAVLVDTAGAIYDSLEAFQNDETGDCAENHDFFDD